MAHASARKQDSADPSGTFSRPDRTLPTGTILEGRYQIQRVIGLGGMSTVYAARDLRFRQVERIAAIKEMVDQNPDAGTRALRLVNFERESALLATISHPAVPRIYDYFSQNGLVYLVIEFIDGTDLERSLMARGQPYPEEMVVPWALEISSVLKMLHNFEPDPIVFRDLKPSNIMLRNSGQIALVDFGIARMFEGHQRGTMVGTEGYAPPEQYRGVVDARGDIYALGATLHHLITNSDPRQEAPFTFHERPVRTLNPDVSEAFAAAISNMVAYHPDQRFGSIDEVVDALEAMTDQQQKQGFACPLGSAEPTTQNAGTVDQRTESVAQAAPNTTIITASIEPQPAVQTGFKRRRASRKRRTERQAEDQRQALDRIAWKMRSGDEVRATGYWDGERFTIGSYDRYVYAINPVNGTVFWKFPTGAGVVTKPARAGKNLVVGSEDGSVYGIDADSGSLCWTCRSGRPIRSSAAVRAESAFVGSDDGSMYALDAATGEINWRSRLWGPIRSSPVLTAEQLFTGSDDGYFYGLDQESGSTVWREPCGGPVRSTAAVAGSRVYVTSWYGIVTCFQIDNGRRIWQRGFDTGIASSPSVRGDVLVVGIADGALVGLNTGDGSTAWTARFANQITSTALMGSQNCYVGTIDGDCLAVSIATGEMLWKHRLGGPIVSSPVLAGEVLVVGSVDGNVYGVALTDDELDDLSSRDA